MSPNTVNPETGEVTDESPTAALAAPNRAATPEVDTTEDDDQLTLIPGGPAPTKSVLKVKASKKEIRNELRRGDEIAVVMHLRIDEVSFAGESRFQIATVVDMLEHDVDAPPAVALQSATNSPFPPEEGGGNGDATFERGEDAPPVESDELDWE